MTAEKITCDDCGTLNVPTRQNCELCGESLHEEQERKRQGSLGLLIFAATGLTLLCFVLPAVGIYGYLVGMREMDLSPAAFGLAYVGVWVVFALISNRYAPKDQYNFGIDLGHMGYMDNPLSLRDNYDRGHASVGVALAPVNLVVGSWRAVWARMKT